MGRLTYRNSTGRAFINHTYFNWEDGVAYKLAHYEDLEEQGRLIELPCAVGDTVWMVVDNREFKEHMKGCYPPAEELPDLHISEHDFSLLHLPSIGKRVFLTKEEAERELKRLKLITDPNVGSAG